MGYTGGDNPEPTYETVCDGDGHTEALRIEYDDSLTSYEDLLEFYWKNHKGNVLHKQYRSAIWVHDEGQRAAAEKSMEEAMAARARKRGGRRQHPPTEILDASAWHDAEEYHQKYMEKAAARRMPPSFPRR